MSVLLVGFLAIAVVLWPIGWVLLSVYFLWSRQWKRFGRLVLLIPVWLVAPVVCLAAIGPFLPSPDAPEPTGGSGVISVLLSTVDVGVAWWLLLRVLREAANVSRKVGEVHQNGT